jgi:hypothetical protein
MYCDEDFFPDAAHQWAKCCSPNCRKYLWNARNPEKVLQAQLRSEAQLRQLKQEQKRRTA